MSGSEVIALAAVGVSGVIGIATLAFNFWNSSSERKHRIWEHREDNREWYKRTLFEKKLTAVQEAYRWIMSFNLAITKADIGQPDSSQNSELRTLCRDAREWYDRNTVFLYDGLPHASEFIGLINTANAHANGQEVQVWKQFILAEKGVKARADELMSLGEHQERADVPL